MAFPYPAKFIRKANYKAGRAWHVLPMVSSSFPDRPVAVDLPDAGKEEENAARGFLPNRYTKAGKKARDLSMLQEKNVIKCFPFTATQN